MVLDAGHIVCSISKEVTECNKSKHVFLQVEFDTPAVLLKKEGGMLKALVEGSGDRAALYEMADKDPKVL